MKPLVVIPNYMTEDTDADVVGECVASIRKTVSDQVDVLVVDDASPNRKALASFCQRYGKYMFEVHRKEDNEGFSRTVNVGLSRARDEDREVVLMNADMEMRTPGWLKHCRQTTDSRGRPAAVVGALLLYPNGLIQHAGIYFSLLTRHFDHLYRFAPANLPEALVKRSVPVTGAFQYIRPETLTAVGVYDPVFLMGYEDVDYCIRVMNAGLECVFNPNVRAYHFESLFRGHGRKSNKVREWEGKSLLYLARKYERQSFAGLVPNW